MFKNLYTILAIGILLSSCGNQPAKKKKPIKKEKTVVVQPLMVKDTMINSKEEATDNHEKIVQKYGEQWDFCNCVVKMDSITDAMENKKMTPAQEEKTFERWDFIETKCKEFLTFDQTNPDERAAHQRKVNKCLKKNGLRK